MLLFETPYLIKYNPFMLTTFTNQNAIKFASFFKGDPIYPFVYCLYEKMIDGHICLNLSEINSTTINETDYPLTIDLLSHSSFISKDSDTIKPFLLHDNQLYLYKYFTYETTILSYINQCTQQNDLKEQRIKTLNSFQNLDELKDSFNNLNTETTLIDWQFIALLKSFINSFSIITGGPGTGKTTTIAKLLNLLFQENDKLKVALAAPTGKAAIRMKEALMGNRIYQKIQEFMPAPEGKTIHRLLGSLKDSHYFKHNKENLLEYDVIIIDEASMVDLPLMSKLVSAISPATRLILLGDQNQLSSVGAGSLLKDLCDNSPDLKCVSNEVFDLLQNKLPNSQLQALEVKNTNSLLQDQITELQFSRRFSSKSNIGQISKAILTENKAKIETYTTIAQDKDFVLIDENHSEKHIDDIVEQYTKYTKEKNIAKALKCLNNTRVLCATRESEQGIYALNQLIERKLVETKAIKTDTIFYENRPIMITKNTPELKIFNGDIGIIRGGNAYFDIGTDEPIKIHPGLLTDYETVYAMTIHKSQGSEFNNVLVVLPKNEENKILTKQLLYTGVTRAKEKIVIQSSIDTIKRTLDNEVNRISGISNRLKAL